MPNSGEAYVWPSVILLFVWTLLLGHHLYVFFCNGASISIDQEIWCLPYAGFKKKLDMNGLILGLIKIY